MRKIDPLDEIYVSGFPYPDMRPGQGPTLAGVMRSMVEDGVRIHIMRAPTGSGKSPIAMGIARGMHRVLNTILGDAPRHAFGGQLNEFYARQAMTKTAELEPSCEKPLRLAPLRWHNYFHDALPYHENLHLRFLFATPRRALQDQYIKDYGDAPGVTTLKGKANYQCGYDPDVQADECGIWDPANKDDNDKPPHCFQCNTCPYALAAERALVTHPYVILNFHSLQSWLWMKWEGTFGADVQYSMLVVDEAHLLPEFLVEFASVKLNMTQIERDVESLLDEDAFPSGSWILRGLETTLQVKAWEDIWRMYALICAQVRQGNELTAEEVDGLSTLQSVFAALAEAYRAADDKEKRYEYIKKERILSEVLAGYRRILSGDLTHDDYQYFLDMGKEEDEKHDVLGLHCKNPREGFRRLAKNFQHIVLMSGTISPEAFRDNLGIAPEEAQIHDMGITIPFTYRPFIVLGTKKTNMSYQNRDTALPLIAENILKLASLHKNWRGIIHTQSGKNAEALYDIFRRLMPRDVRRGYPERVGRFIFHFRGNKKRHMELFMADTSDNSVLISPSLAEGFDGKDEIARWQCIIKVPYLPRNSGEVKARLQESDGELWYMLQTINTLAQQYGRVNRHPTDFGVTYMLDGGWSGFAWRVGKAHAWVHAPIVFQEGVATSGEFFYPFRDDGSLIAVPTHKSNPLVAQASQVLATKDLLEYLE